MRILIIIILTIVFAGPLIVGAQNNEEFLVQKVSLFPNPVTEGILNLEMPGANMGFVSIYDFLGSKVFDMELDIPSAHHYKLDLSDLSSGKYFIRININDEVVTKKISII